jgi:hypothetical protein
MIVVPGCGWQATKSSVGGAAVDRVSVSIAVHNREGVTAKNDLENC